LIAANNMAFAQTMGTALQTRPALPVRTSLRPSQRVAQRSLVVRADKKIREEVDGAPGVSVSDRGQQDSYERIEAPVRGGEGAPGKIPDGGPPVGQRRQGRDDMFIQNDGAEEKRILGTEVAFPDAMRFNGAAPEVINCRLAMLGAVAAIGAELGSHRTVAEQVSANPQLVAGTFGLIIVASLIPILRGYQRRGGKDWPLGVNAFTPDAELVIGRIAMLGFFGIVLNELVTKTPAL
jgi:hypothetical protein